jgi:hypothetical protein
MEKQKICESRCNQCLFSKNKIVSNARRREILESCKKDDTYFQCHKGTLKGQQIACKGFYDAMPNTYLQVAGRLNMLQPVNPNTL